MATDVQSANEASMTGLIKGIVDDVQRLTKQHLDLLRQEIKDDMVKTREAGTMLAIGLAALMIGAVLLAITLAYVLHAAFYPDLPLWGAFAIVTGVVLAAGLALFFVGLKKFQSFNPLPDETAQALKENVQWLTNPK
jgi:hypothetical protein